jgi:hypothetical protein
MSDLRRIPCIVCNVELNNINPPDIQPNGGLEFTSGGHYGSTVFDPMNGEKLSIVVCDECVENAQQDDRVFHSDCPQARTRSWTPWTRG